MMAEESGSVWSTVKRTTVSTIAAAVVGGLIAWVSGWLPAWWGFIQIAAAWIWSLVSLLVPVPLVILVILVLPIFIRIGRAVRHAFAQEAPAVPQAPAAPPLNDLERALLKLLAHADGRYVKFEDAADHLGSSRLLLERACEALYQRGFIEPHQHVLHGAQILLTRTGRDFVIEQGYRIGRDAGSW